MVIIQNKQKTIDDYKNSNQDIIRSSKQCNERDLPCSFRPVVLMAPPR